MDEETTMTTEHGLRIVKSQDRQGKLRVELHRPEDDYRGPGCFSTITQQGNLMWGDDRRKVRMQTVVDAIRQADRIYADQLRQRADAIRARQAEPDIHPERTDRDWRQVIDTFGPKPDATD